MAKKNKILLIIEDDEVLLRALYLKFMNAGYRLSSATDGETGLQIAQRIKPDLILLDLILPKMDGFKVLEALKSDPALKEIPVIVLSNLGDASDVDRANSLGAEDYFVKANTKLEDLQKKVESYLK